MPAQTPTPSAITGWQAVLWDFDGTLADTEPAWWAAEIDMMHGWGAEWTLADAESLVGQSIRYTAGQMIDRAGRDDDPDVVADQLVDHMVDRIRNGQITWIPGARELVAELAAAGVRQALVSSSYRRMLDAALVHFAGDPFSAVVAGDEVERVKPDPLPYTQAAAALGVDPTAALVFEDSPTGVAAATASGAVVYVVGHHPMPEKFRRLSSFEGLGVADLEELHRAGSQ
ncbi:HAD family hydrolase [Parenemella sanctibonifatiensis]|uniref:HAD family phosphatase n=1 Tax=Parenemella sanctibonifatiensis TaxID=2016505 RepID=A0A255E4K2_9ACTN|nr:HAD family phosphatase [Parenemella sanctibonifatiensis]OYN86498.1 hypothetical protein CGZ92_09135 [Parenemella sanctibonifatiensis]